jgi:hypothetical protein
MPAAWEVVLPSFGAASTCCTDIAGTYNLPWNGVSEWRVDLTDTCTGNSIRLYCWTDLGGNPILQLDLFNVGTNTVYQSASPFNCLNSNVLDLTLDGCGSAPATLTITPV